MAAQTVTSALKQILKPYQEHKQIRLQKKHKEIEGKYTNTYSLLISNYISVFVW